LQGHFSLWTRTQEAFEIVKKGFYNDSRAGAGDGNCPELGAVDLLVSLVQPNSFTAGPAVVH